MKYLSYHGKLDETHLRRINVTLHSIAQNKWSIVRNYSRQYNVAYNSFRNSDDYFLNNSDDSDFYSKTNEIQDLALTLAQQDVNAADIVTEAMQEAGSERDSIDNEIQNEEQKSFEELYQEYMEATQDEANQKAEAAQAVRDGLAEFQQATQDLREAIANQDAAVDARDLAEGSTAGTGTYTNPVTGETQTVTNDGNGTISISGVTASDGTVGTVTQHPDGTTTFTTEDGQTMPWSGGSPAEIADAATTATQTVIDEKTKDYNEIATDLKNQAEQAQHIGEENTGKALDAAEAAREEAQKNDPDTSNGNDDWGDWGDFANGGD